MNSDQDMSFKRFLVIVMGAIMASACTKPSVADDPVVISINSERAVSIPAEGGNFRVEYSVAGTSSSVSVSVDADWMSPGASDGGIVDVHVLANETGTSRIGRLKLSCPGAEDQSVTVSQAAKKGEVLPRGRFEVKVSDIHCDKAAVSIIPDDYSVSYSWGVISRKEYLAMGKEAFIKSRIEMMEGLAALYGRPFSELLQTGPLTSSASDLFDNTDYYVVVFALDERKLIPSEVSIVRFKSNQAKQSDMTIGLSVIGTQMLVSPSGDATYVCDCTLKSTFDSYEDPMDIAREYVSTLRMYGYLSSNVFSGQHSENLSSSLVDGLIPGMQYVCYAVGYTLDPASGPGFTTRMYIKEFTYANKQ